MNLAFLGPADWHVYLYGHRRLRLLYAQVRKAAGLGYMQGFKPHPANVPAPADEINALLSRPLPFWLALVGFGSLAAIAWLMMFKPF